MWPSVRRTRRQELNNVFRLATLREAGAKLGRGTVEAFMRELFQPRSWGSMAESETYAHLEHLRLSNEASVDDQGTELIYEVRD